MLFSAPGSARAQNDATATIIHIANVYTLVPNITYRTVSNWEAKLDVIQPRGLRAPNPTLIYYHGGGWTAGTKEGSTISRATSLDDIEHHCDFLVKITRRRASWQYWGFSSIPSARQPFRTATVSVVPEPA